MSLRSEQCKKVCRILDDVLANRPTERDSLIVAVQKAFEVLETAGSEWTPCSERLPKVGVNVLVCDIDNDIYLTHMSPYKSFYDEFCDYIKNVKAWMPLPDPWKGEE